MKRWLSLVSLVSFFGCSADAFTSSDDSGSLADSSASDALESDASADAPIAPSGDGGNDVLDASTLPETSSLSSYRIFITASRYTGNLGGLSGGDALCASEATAGSLGGHWKAWLSTSTLSASARLYHSTVPYVGIDGFTIASSWTELTSGTIERGIDIDQYDIAITFDNNSATTGYAWTGTDTNGSSSIYTYDCGGWTSSTSPNTGTSGYDT